MPVMIPELDPDPEREDLDDITIDRAIREPERSKKPHGLDLNRELTQKLIKGVQVARGIGSGAPHSRNVIVKFIDFDPARQDNNRFVATNQFRIDTIGRVQALYRMEGHDAFFRYPGAG